MSEKIVKHKIPVTIYNTVVNLCIVQNIDHMQDYLDKKVKGAIDVSGADGCVFDLFTNTGVEYYIVLVEDALSHNLIAHEVYHLATKISSDINITDEESVAWLTGHLTEYIYKGLKKKKYNIDK